MIKFKILFGFHDGFKAPHSRHTTVYKEDIEKVPELEIVSESDKAGVFIVENKEKISYLLQDTWNMQ